jgi:amidophosphoribosyltransferase
MSDLHHECGIAAIYHLPGRTVSPLCPEQGPEQVSRLIPRMLLDIQNRGQLSAGMTSYNPNRDQLLDTHKELGSVTEVFNLSRRNKAEALMQKFAGRAALGHVRYATCGAEDRRYAQPFERKHLQKHKWFSFGFNGQIANYQQLRDELLAHDDFHLARDTDTEILMHEIGRQWSGDLRTSMVDAMRNISKKIDGAWSIALLNAMGDMLLARDPLGIKPLCYVLEGPLFAAASESVALLNLGFSADNIKSLEPGCMITIIDGEFKIERFAESPRSAHCFFEWIYFANVASTMDERSVYLTRTRLGEELARLEPLKMDDNTIVVPVPDTSKAAADSMAYRLNIPSREGLIRNRYSGRTFIEGASTRKNKAESKYTPLREVLEGKRVILVEDSIVRSTTMKVLLKRIRELGHAKEIHVRIACPPIVAPCFYGIDMSTIGELFAPKFLDNGNLTIEAQDKMAKLLGADSLRYLPISSIAHAVKMMPNQLCQACVTGEYPTPVGRELYQIALADSAVGSEQRTYETRAALTTG